MGLAKKLTNTVLLPTALGLCLILVAYVALLLEDVPHWGGESKDVMIELETANIGRLALRKTERIEEIFARAKESLSQLQAFGEQILMEEPETAVVNEYVDSVYGLRVQDPSEGNWNFSSW